MNAKAASQVSIMAVGILTTACDDDPAGIDVLPEEPQSTPEEFADAASAAQADASRSVTIYDNFFSRISVAFSADSLRPDASIVLRVTATANADATGGTVRVVLPTKAAIESGSARRPRSPLNTSLPTTGQWQLPAMSEGDTWTQTVTVGRLASGYYQVAVFVDAEGAARSRSTGGYLTDEYTREARIAVKPEGGKLTEVFDRSVFADSITPVAGPFRVKPPYVTTSSAASLSSGDVAGDSDDPVELEITYLNLNWQQVAAVGAEVVAVVPRIESHLEHSRSQINWRSTGTDGRSSYDPDNDQIIFCGTYWRQWTAAHEFGHAIHATNLGGLWNTTNCTEHNCNDPSSYTCAFSVRLRGLRRQHRDTRSRSAQLGQLPQVQHHSSRSLFRGQRRGPVPRPDRRRVRRR